MNMDTFSGLDVLELARSRRSVRTFDGRALSSEDKERILGFANEADNPYGLPIVWRILDAKEHGLTSPVIVGSDIYIAGKMKRADHAEEAFGYSFEKIVLFAQSLRVGTTWIAGTMNRKTFENAMEVSSDEVMPCVSPLGYPAKRMSLRETMMRKGIRADNRFDFGQLFFESSFENPISSEKAGKLSSVLEAVRLAPSAVNKQPWRVVLCGNVAHFYEKRSKGYITEDGWDLQKIDIGIALCHFDLAARQIGYNVSIEVSDPSIPTAEDTRYIASCILA